MAGRSANKAGRDTRRGELFGIMGIAAALVIGLSLFSYSRFDTSWGSYAGQKSVHNLIGRFGAHIADYSFQLFGGGAFLIPFYTLIYGINRFMQKERRYRVIKVLGGLLVIVSLSSLLRLRYDYLNFGDIRAGGWIGDAATSRMLDFFGRAGSYILTVTVLLCALVLSTTVSLMSIIVGIKSWIIVTSDKVRTVYAMRAERKIKRETLEKLEGAEPVPPPEIMVPKEPRPAMHPAPERMQEALPFTGPDRDYALPPLSLLNDPPAGRKRADKDSLIMNSSILEKKLADFGVEGKVVQVNPGPVVTMYEFEPAPGVKVNRISTLSDDLALAMRAESVRIVAPLPGKAAVGVEIPNNVREEVFVKEIMSSPEFLKHKTPLNLALGKDIYGNPMASDLGKMPHLLVAGATGSGKSVAINTMTISLLMSAKPRDLRLLMVDPKRLELSVYDGIPHLLEPVITEPRRAAASLRRVVVVMEERYKLLAEKGVRNIEGFNQKALEEKKHPRLGVDTEEREPRREAVINEDGTIPYIVVIIDELADLMMVAAKEVEDSIARLAQMARASGIHLLLATQRPSVDVLTGVIKANFPARMSFQVSSKTDSRTILDANGAEALLGKGDMLFLPPGTSKLTRIHGSYVSEEEIKRVVDFLKKQAKPKYDAFSAITAPAFDAKKGSGEMSDEDARDAKYLQAVQLVMDAGKASASMLQRRMRIGYPTAARMIEMMEDDGIVGPKKEGGKEREVFQK